MIVRRKERASYLTPQIDNIILAVSLEGTGIVSK